jgi:hypothetical protein
MNEMKPNPSRIKRLRRENPKSGANSRQINGLHHKLPEINGLQVD